MTDDLFCGITLPGLLVTHILTLEMRTIQGVRSALLTVIAERSEKLGGFFERLFDKYIKVRESQARATLQMTRSGFWVILLIVVSAGALTYVGKIEGSTFTFFLGLIVGHVLSYIRETVASRVE